MFSILDSVSKESSKEERKGKKNKVIYTKKRNTIY